MNEIEICKKIINWLTIQHWEVYQEVSMGYGMNRADIVAKLGSIFWVIEVKKCLSFKLYEQAKKWAYYSHLVSVAVPKRKTSLSIPDVLQRTLGIGLIYVDCNNIVEIYKPKLHRTAKVNIFNNLMPQQKYWSQAGSQYGYWTPFAETSRKIKEKVIKNPGITFKDLMVDLKHHYRNDSTALSCIRQWVNLGKIKGVEVVKDGKLLRLYSSEQ